MTSNLPRGYKFSTVEAAIKKPGRKDLALIYSEKDAVVSGMFTTNLVKAAPVVLSMKNIKKGLGRAIIINSGNANACTGKQGLKDTKLMIEMIANFLLVPSDSVYVCSTGVIGTSLPMDRIIPKIDELVSHIGISTIDDLAEAIMTTDTFKKISSRKINISDSEITITGICKGAGMICPNMATMLSFILTDAHITKRALDEVLKYAVDNSFNRISVDGDMSTNDTVLLFANALSGNSLIDLDTDSFKSFSDALSEVCLDLAKMIVKDGEGATKCITLIIKGAKDEKDARKASLAVANSMLVKTAIYGNDANWGRIMAAIGYSGAKIVPERVSIFINDIKIVENGISTGKDKQAQESMSKNSNIEIMIDLAHTQLVYKFYTCDLTGEYVKINAEYRT
ncbi:MAG TPA: bifunctional glutamate N-acetyltransferase/amino-acid acetyltransferase ArgJ [Nitrospirae bacterium]|nr:bifunctional glutamate N-acetyltransferase/amino-acid acetyltransferase ArgJ [Nitrospirota bacterium]